MVIGGDFNLKGMDVDKKVKNSGITREEFTERNYTFRTDIGEEHSGRTIDHILSKGYPCKSWVSQNERFLSDHIPIVAEVCVTGSKKKEDRIIGNKTIPSIRPGDAGAKRRLLKEMDKIIADGLDTWTHDQLVVWTANKAKEIARSRNRKNNPDGWSPLTRLMRLKVRILGMAYRRMEGGKGYGDCYKAYKETKRNMREVLITDEEQVRLDDSGVSGSLPDWKRWTANLERSELAKEIKHLNKLTSSRMRKELRSRHDDRMRKIQDAADKGKIRRIIKQIIGGDKDFSLEVLFNEGENTTDG